MLLVGAGAAASAPPLFETLRWTAPGAELEVLSNQPSACLAYDAQHEPMVQAGQALFNTPTLLGGQAAKAGLSCSSCHVNGRDNAHFLMTGVSGKPGTADVTNSFFSAARGNGRFDPVPIPDLAAPGKVSRDPEAKALKPFIRNLIVEEFAGQEPTPGMLEALATYVRAIQSCPGGDKKRVPRELQDQLLITHAALKGAIEMARRGDTRAVNALVAAARHQLGLISERYAAPKLKRDRELLLKASRELQSLVDTDVAPGQFLKSADNWIARFENNVAKPLMKNEKSSLYDSMRAASVIGDRPVRK